jgi:hypothetical protein
MTLPTTNPKRFLAIEDRMEGFSITAEKQQADELAALLTQRGIPCRVEDSGEGTATLIFDSAAEREATEEVLQGYTQAKGS